MLVYAITMKIIRTPESRFENLPDYPFKPHYINVADDLRLHYLEEGPPNAPTILLLHGEPSWSFLYRKMIPILVDNGFHIIAPDLIGFGKSDKPTAPSDYTYQRHVHWIKQCIKQLDLHNIILFCQDWGGLLGLRIATEMKDRFSMIIASNTALPIGKIPLPQSFLTWRTFSQESPHFNIGKVIDKGTVVPLSKDVIAAYNAPFPTEEYKAGARIFPSLVPTKFDDHESAKNRNAWTILSSWKKPFLTLFGTEDHIMKGAEKIFQQIIPGTKGQPHALLHAVHFIQEEIGKELAQRLVEFYHQNQ